VQDPELREAIERALTAGAFALPDAVRAIRALHGLSQAELASHVGLSVNVIKSIEAGRGNPKFESVRRIAAFAGLEFTLLRRPYEVSLFDPTERNAEKEMARAADWADIESGRATEREVDERNAMRIGPTTYDLPELK
jgi:transcriptional regulator with XRE-family HTH domain